MKRYRAQAGETLPETLVALLIVVTTFLFLTGAVVAAGRVNDSMKNDAVAFRVNRDTDEPTPSFEVVLDMDVGEDKTVTVYKQEAENGYVYYTTTP